MRVVSRTLFGHDVTSQIEKVGHAMSIFQSSLLSFEVIPEWLPTPGKRAFQRALASLDEVTYGIIEKRKRDIEADPNSPGLSVMAIGLL